jgi:Tfp pilus assembly protein PilO
MRANLNGWLVLLGWQGIVGLGLLIGVAGFYISVVGPQQAKLAELHQEIAELRAEAAHPQEEQRNPTEVLGAFYENFPGSTRLPAALAVVFEAAKAQGLALDQGEYKVATSHVGRLVQYQITLPVRGSYPQIRRFIDAAMARQPALSLQSIHFERQKVEDPGVQAKIKLVMFLGEER